MRDFFGVARPGPRRFVLAACGLLVGALALGCGVVLQALGWTALVVEASGRCGGRLSPACPQGMGWVMVLAFALFPVGVPLILAGVRFGGAKQGVRRAKRVRVIVLVAGLLTGLGCGWPLYQALRGPHLEVRWTAELDRPSQVLGVGGWMYDTLAVRARVDRLTAHETGDGRVAWTFEIPGRASLCTMSREAEDGVGLVGWAVDGRPCDTVAAIDLRTGRALWQRTRSASGSGPVADQLAVAGGTAVFAEPSGLRAVGLRQDADRWRFDAAEGCTVAGVSGSQDQVSVLTNCADNGAHVAALDSGTGQPRWQAALPVVPPIADLTLVAANPVVVHAAERGTRAATIILSFDDKGGVRAKIPLSGPDYDIAAPETSPYRPSVVVSGDWLIALTTRPGSGDPAVSAFSLSAGQRLWTTALEGTVGAMDLSAGRLTVATNALRIFELSLDNGEIATTTPVRGRWWLRSFELWRSKGGYVISVEDGADRPPVMAVG